MSIARLVFAFTCMTCPSLVMVIWAALHLGHDITQPLLDLSCHTLAAIWSALQMDKDVAATQSSTTEAP